MITVLELNFLVASDLRMFAGFQMIQHITSGVSFLKMLIGRILFTHVKDRLYGYYLSPNLNY